jgi:D-alanyl-D-alanine carboxypeptidase/D-alanyl-D-alanine-endopeptidase (penicillin-binding protein 4)
VRLLRSAILAAVALTASLHAAATQVDPQGASTAGPASRARLAEEINTIISRPGVSRATWGISIRSLGTDDALYEHNARALLVPASIAKLAALASAVDAVGWDFTFETTVRATGLLMNGVLRGDLVVVGSGDPSIGGRAGDDFGPWIEAIKAAGITRIDGRIIGDDDAIDDPRPGAMWAWDDLGYTSGALFGALNYGENRMVVTVSPGDTPGAPTTLSVPEVAQDRPLVNRSVTGPPGSPLMLWPEQRPGELALTIAGSIPSDARPSRLTVSAGDPTRWFVSVLRHELQRAGIAVTGGSYDIDDVMPKPDLGAAGVVYAHRSRPLAELARPMLKDSINLYSEAVFRMSTGVMGGRTNDDALAALSERLTAWGLQPDGVQIVDGSGLSRRDGLAADTLVSILARMYDPTMESPWMTGLPVAGRDGSLENRLRNTPAESNIRAKTGTMTNIRSLAGYVRSRDREPLAFVIMVNNFEGTGQQAQAAVDEIAVALAAFSRQ